MRVEDLERLKQPVFFSDFPGKKLTGSVISGPSRMIAGAIRGSHVFEIGFGHRNSPHDWTWKKRDKGPTKREYATLQDWPGINNGDAVTHGHLSSIGIKGENKCA